VGASGPGGPEVKRHYKDAASAPQDGERGALY
jgi:hypothetical protein